MVDHKLIIEGQTRAENLLNTIINKNKIPHAFLFEGKEGVGKFYSAIQFSKFINKKFVNESILHRIERFEAPYVKYIIPLPRGKNETPDDGPLEKLDEDTISLLQDEIIRKSKNPFYKIKIEKANNIKISSIREISKFTSFDYSDINYRTILIEHADLMNEQSQNALLKNLEEPPSGTIFILITSNLDKILTTIKSRCWIVSFQSLPTQIIEKILIDKFDIKKQDAELISVFSGGSVDFALKLYELEINEFSEKVIKILRFSFGGYYNTVYNLMENIAKNNEAGILKVLVGMIFYWLIDVERNRKNIDLINFNFHKDTIIKFNSKFSKTNINSLYSKLNRLMNLIDSNVSLNIILLNIIFELRYLLLEK